MMYGAQSYISGPEELDKICAIYKNDLAATARSVNMKDIDAITGITTADKIKEVDMANSGTNPSGEKHQYGGTYSFANHYTPESWLNGKTQTTVTGTIDGYGYAINAPAEAGRPSATVSDTRLYNLLFENVEWANGMATGRAYWLASRGVYAGSGTANFGPGAVVERGGMTLAISGYDMFYSAGDEYGDGFAVRPVVVLRSDVTESDIQKIEDKTETTWNYGSGH